TNGRSINVANSFGVPFEEDDRDAKTWFLDHNYVESMFEVIKKVNGAFPSRYAYACGNASVIAVIRPLRVRLHRFIAWNGVRNGIPS
ncbi:hypothetical protein BJY52DRAFT_1298362, partial [Lactarius psammicola]